jgi:hypothetical protein
MFSGLETRRELNGLLDELYGGGQDGAYPGEARGSGRRAARREAEYPKEAQELARAGGHQLPRGDVVTRQKYEEEREQVTPIASEHEEEDRMPAEERCTDGPKKEQGLVDKAVDKAREKGFIDKANEAVDRIMNKFMRR